MEKYQMKFRGQVIDYECYWSNNLTFCLCFGEGIFTDSDGDNYFILCEYHKDVNRFVFVAYFEDDCVNISDFTKEYQAEYLTDSEQEMIKRLMIDRMEGC